ncbi:MAG TPA: isochorismatase family cysteine hydrolase [Acidimicrobiia bacterium]|nr:isochorismatase family cysteine hydrolase [Acidimicrobiia bacterium]
MANEALLVMDVQQGIVERFAPRAEGLLDALERAIDAARQAWIPVVYVRIAFRPGAPEVSRRNRAFAAVAQASGFGDQDEATQIHARIAPQPGDVVVLKKRVSAFAGSDLDVVLRSLQVETLVLTGIATSGVVLSTLRQAADLDYGLAVLRDGCADGDDEVHRVLLDKVFARQATVLTVDEWVASVAS